MSNIRCANIGCNRLYNEDQIQCPYCFGQELDQRSNGTVYNRNHYLNNQMTGGLPSNEVRFPSGPPSGMQSPTLGASSPQFPGPEAWGDADPGFQSVISRSGSQNF